MKTRQHFRLATKPESQRAIEAPMNIRWTPLFQRDFKKLPKDVQSRAEKAIRLLKENPRYPSLRSRKMAKVENIWEASVTLSHRITYEISGQTLILRRIGAHDILKVESRGAS